MSEEKSGPGRQLHDIDLGKDAVKDVTPPGDAKSPPAEPIAKEPPPAQKTLAQETKPPAREGGRTAPVVGGAVAGGVLGLLSAVFFQNFERPAVTVADPRVAQVETAIAAVEKKAVDASGIEQRLQAQVKAAENRIAAMTQQAEAAVQRAAAVEGRTAALEQKAAALEQKAAAVDQRTVEAEARASAVIKPVAEQVKGVEARLAEGREQLAGLSKRIDLLAQIEPPKVDLRPVVSKVDELEKSIASTVARVTLSGEAAAGLDGRVKSIEQGLKTVESASKGNEASIKSLETAVTRAGRRPVETASAVIAIATLARRSLEAGEAVAGPVAAMRALGVSDTALKPLAAFESGPALSVTALADLYADTAAKLPKPDPKAAAVPKSDSIVDRVTSGIWSQVDVRAVGTARQPDATGIGTEMRQKLLAGDLAGAQRVFKALAQEQQAGLKPFGDALAARIDALSSLAAIERDALVAAQKG